MDDFFGFPNPNEPKSLTPPPGYEPVHRDGMSWARRGPTYETTSRVSQEQWNHLIAQFRGLATLPGVNVDDVAATSPLLLREFIARAVAYTVVEVLSGEDIEGYGVLTKALYDPDHDGIIGLAQGGTGFAAGSAEDLRDKLGISAAIKGAVDDLVASSPEALDTLKELSAALGDDPNFAATTAAALATRLRFDAAQALTPAQRAQALANLGLDEWSLQPIGVAIPVFDHIAGVSAPPLDQGYRYIRLSAGHTGAGGYNAGVLKSESVSGTAPLVIATATVDLATSPLNGKAVSLINTERRFLRAGQAGVVEQDALQEITGRLEFRRPNSTDHLSLVPTGAFADATDGGGAGNMGVSVSGSTPRSRITFTAGNVARTSDETRPKNIGATYYMRIK
ncbi:hypothetical protein [Mesorhizobium sp. KR2-14]|uniref:hypothetical protein n=1 Tax=Mesorhizobium sp. KR2-14 TaxID=3156610 RepID=UPI0032B43FA0